MDWNALITRTEVLERRYHGAAKPLRFYRALARFQMEIYHRARAEKQKGDPRRLDTPFLASFFPDFLQLVESYGTSDLARQAQKVQDRQDWEDILRACWQRSRERMELFARAILQPYVRHLSERWLAEVGTLDLGTGNCPFCSRRPLLGVTNGQRVLVCSLCATDWAFPRDVCPACGAQGLATLNHRSLPHVRAEACPSCRNYLKVIDLDHEPAAVPFVDELAAVELDALARHKGYCKLETNLAGL